MPPKPVTTLLQHLFCHCLSLSPQELNKIQMRTENFNIPSRKGDDDENNLDIKKVSALVIENWYCILLSLFFFVAVAFLYIRYATPKYEIDATVLVEDPEKTGG